MNLENIDTAAIGNILSSLSADDISSLQDMAQSMFSANQAPPKKEQPEQGIFGGMDFESIAKIASIMGLLSAETSDPRADLLKALKPLLKSEKQQKVDQAIRMLRLLSIIPKLKELNGG